MEIDLEDMSSLASHGGHRYVINPTDAFSKYVYSVPIRSKNCEAFASAFQSVLPKTGNSRRLLAH